MAALTQDVKITRYGAEGDHEPISQPIGATVTLYAGSFAVTDGTTGLLKRATQFSCSAGDKAWGVVERQQLAPATNTQVPIKTGTFFFANSGGSDVLTQAQIGQTVYIVDEVTVGSSSTNRATAGVLKFIDTTQPGGYAVQVGSSSTTGEGP